MTSVQALADRPQTWVQLDRLLERAGYGESDRERVRAAHELAMELFSGWYRPSGRPFVSHLVGTAGIAAALAASCDLVLAALLHAAYASGDFGTGAAGPRPAKRARVRAVAGERAEDLVRRYTRWPWNAEAIGEWARAPQLDGDDRDLALLRLANELDELLDLGPLYSAKADSKSALAASQPAMLELARGLGQPVLARALGEAWEALSRSEVPASLRSPHAVSYFRSPASQWTRPGVRLRRLLALSERRGRRAWKLARRGWRRGLRRLRSRARAAGRRALGLMRRASGKPHGTSG